MWILTIFWQDGAKTKEYYDSYERVTHAIEYFITLGSNRIRHFKLKYRGDLNE